MNERRRTRAALSILFVSLFALWWGVAVLISKNAAPALALASDDSAVPIDISGGLIVHHLHTSQGEEYQGTVSVPSSCDVLGSGLSSSGSAPEHMTILLTVALTPGCTDPSGTTEQSFEVSVTSQSPDRPILDGITVNGVIASTSLIEDKQ